MGLSSHGCCYVLPFGSSQVLKKKILGAVGQESSEEGEKITDMLMAFALHQVGSHS